MDMVHHPLLKHAPGLIAPSLYLVDYSKTPPVREPLLSCRVFVNELVRTRFRDHLATNLGKVFVLAFSHFHIHRFVCSSIVSDGLINLIKSENSSKCVLLKAFLFYYLVRLKIAPIYFNKQQ